MIHEYALEPETVATWGNLPFIFDQFGIGTSRIVSDYPKNWARSVIDACKPSDDIEYARLVEIICHLRDKMITRKDSSYNTKLSWLENAELEHEHLPFKAIIASRNPHNNMNIILNSELGHNKDDCRWRADEFPAQREAKAMARAIEPMLYNCREAIFIDPYFTPAQPKKRKPLQEFLRAMLSNRKSHIIRLDLVTKYDSTEADPSAFTKKCQNILPMHIPLGLSLKILRIVERKGKQQIHNRYVLTDIGGVNFGAGLDEGSEGQTDDVGLFKKNTYEMRWRQYSKIIEMKDSVKRRRALTHLGVQFDPPLLYNIGRLCHLGGSTSVLKWVKSKSLPTIGEKFRHYRTFAAWYLWRSLSK